MEQKIYEIGGRKFRFALSLDQDELLAPIVLEMLKENSTLLSSSANAMVDMQQEPTSTSLKTNLLQIGFDAMKLNAWVYAKGYAQRIMATLLVEEEKEFDAKDITEKMIFFGKQDCRKEASELVNLFFQRSGAFGVSTPQSLTSPMMS
jgi:hypothetical protein